MSNFFAGRKLVVFLGAVFAVTLFVACSPSSTPESGSPERSAPPEIIVENFIKAIDANRVDDAFSYFRSPGDAQWIERTYVMLQKRGGLDSVSTRKAELGRGRLSEAMRQLLTKEGDDFAAVHAVMKFKNGSSREKLLYLVKESDEWQIPPHYLPVWR